MAQKDYLRKKVKIHIRDVNMTDSELDDVIDTVVNEIALETRIFKKLFGFTIHKDMEQYDFRYLARLNEQVEKEPTKITFGTPTTNDILDFIANGNFPEIPVNKELEVDPYQSQFIDLLDIFDKDGYSALNKFEERGTATYFCYDEVWRDLVDGEPFVFAGWIKPDINELHDEELSIILPVVIQGCKFFVNDTLHSSEDVQATNYDYMRYYQGKKQLQDRFTSAVYSIQESNKWL
jgi:hypothetical protein